MSTLTRFKAKKEQEKIKAKAQRAAWKEQERSHRAAEKIVYDEFKAYIKPFNGETISGLKIKVVCHDAKREIELFVNGRLHRVFVAETETHYCNCSECHEGPTGHAPDYDQDVNAYRVTAKGKRISDYFSWYGGTDMEREEHFVSSFNKLLENYKSNMDWYGNPDGQYAKDEDNV